MLHHITTSLPSKDLQTAFSQKSEMVTTVYLFFSLNFILVKYYFKMTVFTINIKY